MFTKNPYLISENIRNFIYTQVVKLLYLTFMCKLFFACCTQILLKFKWHKYYCLSSGLNDNFFSLGHVHKQRADGLRAQLAYEKALKDGYVKVYRGRILLIGQDRAGKTSLKKSLLGLPFDPKEQSTEGIEVDPSKCEIDVDQVKNWHSTSVNKPVLLEHSKDVAKIVAEKMIRLKEFSEEEEDSADSCEVQWRDDSSSSGSEEENVFHIEKV